MEYIGIILEFVTYIILESLIVQNVHVLSNIKIKDKIYAFCVICEFSLLNCVMINSPKLNLPSLLLFLISILLFTKRFILYVCVFEKINRQILYIFLTALATNQIYFNIVKKVVNDKNFRSGLSYLIEILIIMSFMIYMKKNKKEEVYKQIIYSLPKKLYVLVLVMLIIASVFVMAATRDDTGNVIQYFLLPSMIGLVLSTIAIIKIGISESEKNSEVALLSRQIENQIGYYEKINKIYGEFRSFRHDYKNHVLCLRGLIAADKKEEALEYMNTMQDMSSVGKNRYHTGNVIIDALLDDKSDKAEKVKTKIDFEGVVPTSGISNADLCVIMANAIDNAIEACSKDESENEKTIKVDADFRQGYFFFKASNPMFEKVIFKGKNKVTTSKSDKEHHGFGVANIVHTAEKYGGTAEISTDDGQFTIDVQLMLEQFKEETYVY